MTDSTRRTVLAGISAISAMAALPTFTPSFGALLVPETASYGKIADALEHFWQSGYMPELIAIFRAEDKQVFTDVADALEGRLRRGEMPKVIADMRAAHAQSVGAS